MTICKVYSLSTSSKNNFIRPQKINKINNNNNKTIQLNHTYRPLLEFAGI